MNETKKLLLKIFILLTFGVGWSCGVWAQSFPVAGKVYTIKAKFANATYDSYLTNGGSSLTFPQTVSENGSFWIAEQSGNSSFPWRFKSVTDGTKYLNADNGLNASGTNFNVRNCTSISGLYHLQVVTSNRSTGTWGVGSGRSGFGGFGYGGCWSSNNGHYNAGSPAWTTDYEIVENILLGNNVNVKFLGANGEELSGGAVNYTKSDGTVEQISTSTYNFGNKYCPVTAFATLTNDMRLVSINYDEGTQTLSFTITPDPNSIRFSDVPTNGQWAANTQWFTWRNNRTGQSYNRSFITTSAASVNDNCDMLPILASMPNDRGSYWCFVGNNTNGFVIQNAAYGPDFVLGIKGNDRQTNTVRMLHKDNIPSGYNTVFTAVENSVRDGATHAWAFRIGLTGNSHLHVTNGTFIRYNHENISGNDTGSAFLVTAADVTTFNALQAYDVYTVRVKGAPNSVSVSYTNSSVTFGKRGVANNGAYMILNAGSEIAKNQFASSDANYDIISAEATAQAGHACKLLTVTLKDALATDEYIIKINKPESHGGNVYKVTYGGDEYDANASVYYRPEVTPEAIDFNIIGADDCFVWGPVINRNNKTITYDVRDRMRTLETGLYELQLKDQSVIDAINAYVKPYEGNINTPANQQYLAPTVFSVGNATMKFTGVPVSAIGDETSIYVYVTPLENNKLAILTLEGYYARSVAFNANGDQTHTQVPIDYEIDGDGYLHIKGWGTAQHPMEGLLQQGGQGATDMKFAMYMPEQSQDIFDVYQVQFAGSYTNTRSVRYKGEGVKSFGIASNGGYIVLAAGSKEPSIELFSVLKGTGRITDVAVTGDAQHGQAKVLTVTLEDEPEQWQFSIVGSNPNNEKIVYNGQEYESGTIVNLPKGTVINPKDIKTTSEGFVYGPFITKAIDQNDVNKVTFQMRSHVTEITPHKWYAIQLRNKEVTYNDGSQKTGMLVDVVNNLDSRYKGSYIYMGGNLSGNTQWAFELTGVTTEATEGLVYVDDVQEQPNGDLRVYIMLQNGKYVQSDGQMTNSKQYITIGRNAVARSINNDTFIWKTKVMPWKNLNGMPVGVGYAGGNPREDNIEMYLTEGEVDAFKIIIKNASTNAELNGVTVSYNGNAHLYGRKRFTNGQFRFVEKGYHLELESEGHPDKSKFIARDGYVITNIELSDGDYHDLTIYVQQPTYTNSIIHTVASYYDDLDHETNLPGTGFIKRGEGLMNYVGKNGEVHTVQNTAVYEIPLYLKQGQAFTGYEPQGTNDTGGSNQRLYQRWYNYDLDGLEPDAAVTKLTDIVTDLPTSNASYKKTNGYLTGTSYGGQFLSPTFILPNGVEEYNVGLDAAFSAATASGSNLIEPTLNMRVVYRIKNAKIIADAIKAASGAGKFYEVHDIMMPNIKKGSAEDHTGADVLPLDMDLNNYWMYVSATDIDNVKESSSGVHLVVEIGENTAGIVNAKLIPNGSNAIGGISYASFNTGHFICFQYPGDGTLRQVPANSKATINVYIQKGSDVAGRQKMAQFNLTFIPNSEPMIVPEAMASSRSDNEMASKYTLGAQMTFENVHVPASNSVSQRYKYPLDFKNSSYGFRADPWAARSEYNLTQYNTMSGPDNYKYTYYPIQAYQNNVADPTSAAHNVSDNDHFLYIDAADQAGNIFNIDLDAQLCVGSRLFCYGWVGCTVGNYTDQHPASVLINVIGYDSDDNEHLISSFNPGMISARGYDKDGNPVYSLIHGRYPAYTRYNKDANIYYAVWQQVGFNFLINKATATDIKRYAIQIVNNSYNSNGGDIVLDNFKVYYSSSSAFVDFTTPLCVDETRHVRVHSDFDGLMSKADPNEEAILNGTLTELPVTYSFIDAEIFDTYTGQMVKDKAVAMGFADDKYYRDLTDLSKPMIEYFDIDESTGSHKLKNAYSTNESVHWLMEFAFGEAMVGAPEVNGVGSHKDHGFHSTTFKVNYEANDQYHYQYSVDDHVYREQIGDGEKRLVMKQPVVRHTDALVDEYKRNGWSIEDHERNADGTIKNYNPNYGKVKSSVNGIVHYYTPRMQAGKSYYIIFSQDALTNAELNGTYVGKVATGFYNIEEPCTQIVKFKTPDAMHVITEVENFYAETPQANVCIDGKTLFNFDLHAAKVELQRNPETNKMDAHGTPGMPDYHVHTIDNNVLNYVYDWWVGNGTPYASPYSVGTLKDYEAATSATITYQYGVGENPVPGKDAGQPVNLKTAIEDFRFFYPNFNAHNPQSVAIRIPTTDEWNSLTPYPYNETTGYSLLQSEIDAIKEFVGEDKNGNGKLDDGEGLGLIVLYKQALTLPLDATKYTPDGEGNKYRYVTAHPIIPLQEYSMNETVIYCPEPRDVQLIVKEKPVEMFNGFAGMDYPEDMKDVAIRIGLNQVEAAKTTKLRIPVRDLKFAAGTGKSNFLRAQQITAGQPYGSPIYLKSSNDASLTANTAIANLLGGVTTNNSEDEHYIEIKFLETVQLREGYTYTLALPYEEDASFEGAECNCQNTMDFTLKVVPEYQKWTAAAGNTDWTNDANWERADRSELHADNAATGSVIDGSTDITVAAKYPTNAANERSSSFVPMYFTNVLFHDPAVNAPELYKGSDWKDAKYSTANPEDNTFLVGLNETGAGATSTPLIKYDMEVGKPDGEGNYACELFGTYIANGITFEPGTQLGNAHLLDYQKAWVEYELSAGNWYYISSPLKDIYSGEWYSPTKGGKQLTPHFYDITYQQGGGSLRLNDRFRPAYYQRSWDSKGNNPVLLKNGGTHESYIQADWSHVYNDAKVDYSKGGFSVKPEIDMMETADKPADGKVLVRLPKADTEYVYYDINGATGQAANATLPAESIQGRSRLRSDDFTGGSITFDVTNETSDNEYFLVGNPFMASLDMNKFFDANPSLEPKYWTMNENSQEMSFKTEFNKDGNGAWVSTSVGDPRYVAPLQGFFVKKKANAEGDAPTSKPSVRFTINPDMQYIVQPREGNANNGGGNSDYNPSNARRNTRAAGGNASLIITAQREGQKSTAIVMLDEKASTGYVNTEDCETFIDGNISDSPTVYTVASRQAMTINTVPEVNMIPLGIVSDDDSPVTLTFESDMSEALYLYDAEAKTYTMIDEDSAFEVSGSNSGRYYITNSDPAGIDIVHDDDHDDTMHDIAGRKLRVANHNTIVIVDGKKRLVR